jgi:hypothetical protein
MYERLKELLEFLKRTDLPANKSGLIEIVASTFDLTQDRSIYYCEAFAIRFSSSSSSSFSNTVCSLSHLQKFDDRPFIVCLVRQGKLVLYLANSTFLRKISHSSQTLALNNIRGSFNGSDIVRKFQEVENVVGNFERLFDIHAEIGFEGNLNRLVEATTNIAASGVRFVASDQQMQFILQAPARAERFLGSSFLAILKDELDSKVQKFKNEILVAALIENVNIRGRIIEYLIAGEDETLRQRLVESLIAKTDLPPFVTANSLGDYSRVFESFTTETDVKTKIMVLSSNPKAYNIDKMLEFLSTNDTVFNFYFVGIDPGKLVGTTLVSIFEPRLLATTRVLHHWAGRNSRGVTQFDGSVIATLVTDSEPPVVDAVAGELFLRGLLDRDD